MKRTRIVLIIIIAILTIAFAFSRSDFLSYRNLKDDRLFVARVVDGDTVVLSNGERVRLIGIDTPEIHFSKKLLRDAEKTERDIETIQRLGERAKAFVTRRCLGKRVHLEYDVEKKDKYEMPISY